MSLNYSIHKAKARFSEVIRRVRECRIVTVSYRREPVAETRAIDGRSKQAFDERLEGLERNGTLIRSTLPRRMFRPVERRPGALAQFLAERGE